jgi:hypothetical protein
LANCDLLQRAAKQKSNQNLNNAGATPAGETNGETEATPATPITPVNPGFNKNGQTGVGPQATGTTATAVPIPTPTTGPVGAPQVPESNSNGIMDGFTGMVSHEIVSHSSDSPLLLCTETMPQVDFATMELANPLSTSDVLNDFDFDSFLHDNEGENQPFDFNNPFVDGEIQAD